MFDYLKGAVCEMLYSKRPLFPFCVQQLLYICFLVWFILPFRAVWTLTSNTILQSWQLLQFIQRQSCSMLSWFICLTALYLWRTVHTPYTCIPLSLSVGLSPPTAYAAFPTPPAILSEAALYQPPLLAAPRPPQTTAHSPAHTLAYYPPQPHLYMNMNMNYTAYYPR